ncbi:MAG: rod shape-determining protein MreC [Eubacteriales bacterium]|nr:rod shape-determining protein MreC [Eubacteriales bacterium]
MSKHQKKRILAVVLVALAVASIMFFSILPDQPSSNLTSPLSVVMRPFERVFGGLAYFFQNHFATSSLNSQLQSENDRLRSENLALRLEIKDNEQAARAYEDLKQAFSLKDRFPHRKFLAANVLQAPLDPNYAYFRLDVGSSEGIDFKSASAYAVVDENASLLGSLVSSDVLSSKLMPIFHEGFSCSVIAERDPSKTFTLTGQGYFADKHTLLASDVPEDLDLVVGDKIYSSGWGGIFPERLLCGTVLELGPANSLGLRKVEIAPASVLEGQEVLFVLLPQADGETETGRAEAAGENLPATPEVQDEN